MPYVARIYAKNLWTICVLSCKIELASLVQRFASPVTTTLVLSPSILSIGGVFFFTYGDLIE